MQLIRGLGFSGLFVLLLLVSSIPATGQENTYKIGVTGGYTSMTYGGENVSDVWERRTGKSVGGVFIGRMSDSFADLQAEIRYVQKGARAEMQQEDLIVRDRLHYFDFVMLGKVRLPMSRALAPHLLGGVSSNLGAGGTREIEGPTFTLTKPLRSGFESQWALVLGAGIDIAPQGVISLAVDARYTYGLSGAPTDGFGDLEGASFRNQGFMLNAALYVGF